MKKILLIITAILACHSLFSQKAVTSNNLEIYRNLNNKELRLIEFKDDDEALNLKLLQLDIINNSRRKYNAAPVKFDILASRVANKMCREAAENKYVSHWNMNGEKPYHRYAFAGGYDHVSENVYGEWSSATYENSPATISKMMEKGHKIFMAEKAPSDGHKRTIIEKSHNFAGIGYYITDKQFRYYEEFIDRYFEFENIPSRLKINEQGSITLKTDGKKFLYYLIIYREKFPDKISPAQLSKKGSYEDFSKEQYLKIPAWDLIRYRNGDVYKIPLRFLKEGLYYIQIYIDSKENTGARSVNTKGKTAVTGIVIKVEK